MYPSLGQSELPVHKSSKPTECKNIKSFKLSANSTGLSFAKSGGIDAAHLPDPIFKPVCLVRIGQNSDVFRTYSPTAKGVLSPCPNIYFLKAVGNRVKSPL